MKRLGKRLTMRFLEAISESRFKEEGSKSIYNSTGCSERCRLRNFLTELCGSSYGPLLY